MEKENINHNVHNNQDINAHNTRTINEIELKMERVLAYLENQKKPSKVVEIALLIWSWIFVITLPFSFLGIVIAVIVAITR
jgi:hypothetical protein